MNSNSFKLGTFGSNCASGMSITQSPNRWSGSWDDNLRLAQMLDDAGIDFMLPIARWLGYGGETNFHGRVLETMTWTAGLLAVTKRIRIVTTLHTVAHHPLVVARQIATIDAIGGGRAGLNIVAGWNEPEYRALGLALPPDHETRYAYAQEWFDIVASLWTSAAPFDYRGKFFNLQGVFCDPKPVAGRPFIINAAGSGPGRDFAIRNADMLFTPAIDLARSKEEVRAFREEAARAGRDIDVLTGCHIICRPSEKEAREYAASFMGDMIDHDAVDQLVRLQIAHAKSIPHDALAAIRERMAMGHGALPVMGTPQQVAEGLIAVHGAGFGGATLSFFDYAEDFPYFRDTVLPILEQAGLRAPAPSQRGVGGGYV